MKTTNAYALLELLNI